MVWGGGFLLAVAVDGTDPAEELFLLVAGHQQRGSSLHDRSALVKDQIQQTTTPCRSAPPAIRKEAMRSGIATYHGMLSFLALFHTFL